MLDYIVKYQNNFISSYLFRFNFPLLMEKGIQITPLLRSRVFSVVFDFDEWPGNHTREDYEIRPYNFNYFHIRNHYRTIFPEDFYKEDYGQDHEHTRIYKIKYSINLLPIIGEYVEDENDEKKLINEEISLMGLLDETDELEVFLNDSI